MIAQIFILVLALGLPVAFLSFWLLHWSYESGHLSREADRKTQRAELKEMKKTARKKQSPGTNLVSRKWLRFGGGFYGAAGLWTLVVVELVDLFSLIVDWPGIDEVLAGGPIRFLIGFVKNQIQSFVSAITWFDYWSDVSRDANIGLVFLVAIGSYALARRAARKWPS